MAGSAGEAFLRPDNPRFATGIYLIRPYDPNKIPILFIHGLLSSPVSWQNLTSDLCSDPGIIEHNQPWFFLYPTGQPALVSAVQLREELKATQRLFDPKGTAVASHHVVVIAHSMGGILAHTLVSDDGDSLWNSFAIRPFTSLVLPPEEKNLISGYFSFRHQPCIDRVIFLAVPHRGSQLASGILTRIGNEFVRRPRIVIEAIKQLTASNLGMLRPYVAREDARVGPTSLMSLAPDDPLLNTLAALPIRVPFHSMIGDRGLGGATHSSDGVVPYSSAHLPGAESEKIVPAGHIVFQARPRFPRSSGSWRRILPAPASLIRVAIQGRTNQMPQSFQRRRYYERQSHKPTKAKERASLLLSGWADELDGTAAPSPPWLRRAPLGMTCANVRSAVKY